MYCGKASRVHFVINFAFSFEQRLIIMDPVCSKSCREIQVTECDSLLVVTTV